MMAFVARIDVGERPDGNWVTAGNAEPPRLVVAEGTQKAKRALAEHQQIIDEVLKRPPIEFSEAYVFAFVERR